MFNNGFFFGKSRSLWDNVKIYGTARHATDNITGRMRIECWIPNATDTN